MKKSKLEKEFIHPAKQYGLDVLAGKYTVGKLHKRFVERHFYDLDHAIERGFYFDEVAADRPIQFFKFLHHSKGKWKGEVFTLEPWQQFLVYVLFGWMCEDGTRRFRLAYNEIARKNGKSSLASGIALYLLIGDGEGGAEVYSAATKKDQAKIVFLESKRMVQASPALKQRIDVQRDNLNIKGTASKYEPLSSDEDSLDGLNVHGAIVDELHAHKTRAVFDVLDTATGSREQPLIFCITTAGFNKESIAMNLRNYGERVLNEFDIENGVVDDTFFVFIASLDQEDDWQDEKVWVKANPNLGVSVNLKDLQTKANKAKQDPGSQNSFRCKHLNEWTSQEFRYIPMDKWDLGKKEPSFTGEAFGGLDLAKTTDLCSWKLIFPQPNGEIHVKCRFWIPEDNVREKSAVDRIDYIALAQQGFITLVPGATIDYTWIFNAIDEDLKKFNIKEIGFDRYGAESIVQKLDDLGAVVVPVGQGMASMSAPTKELLKYVLEGKIIHGGHPILRWNADNMIVTTDDQDNIKPSKKKSRQKIDGIVALIIALDRFMRSGSGVSVYEEREILTL